MGIFIPESHPGQKLDKTTQILRAHGIDLQKCAFLAVRGYYLDSMGKKGKNDFGVMDDALFFRSNSAYASWNFNTDPVSAKPGHGFNEGTKGRAHLKPGVHLYKPGLHKGYKAFIQAEKFTVLRDADSKVKESDIVIYQGSRYYEDTGYFGINLHKAGRGNVSSIGCQTVAPDQYDAHLALAYQQMKQYKQDTIPYVLIDNTPEANT